MYAPPIQYADTVATRDPSDLAGRSSAWTVLRGAAVHPTRRAAVPSRGSARGLLRTFPMMSHRSGSITRILFALHHSRGVAMAVVPPPLDFSREALHNLRAAGEVEAANGAAQPVLTVDLLQLRDAAAWQRHSNAVERNHSARIVSSLQLHSQGRLCGQPHDYTSVCITEYPSAASAHAALVCSQTAELRQASSGPGSRLLWMRRSAAFAGMPTFAEAGGEAAPTDTGAPRLPSQCPFIAEGSADAAAWEALETEPSDHMYAFNLIRMPDAAAYSEYSAHFKALPAKYGMKFVEVGAVDSDPNASVLLGEGPAANGQSFDLMALVRHPCILYRSSWLNVSDVLRCLSREGVNTAAALVIS
jgi:hypothetical protein